MQRENVSRRAIGFSESEIPLSAAIMICFGVFFLFFAIHSPEETKRLFDGADEISKRHGRVVEVLLSSMFFNLLWIGQAVNRSFGFARQGAKLAALASKKRESGNYRVIIFLSLIFALSFFVATKTNCFELPFYRFVLFGIQTHIGTVLVHSNLALASTGVTLFLRRIFSYYAFSGLVSRRLGQTLPRAPKVQDGIIVGAIHECDDLRAVSSVPQKKSEWILMGLKGLTGNLLITGVIGSGKSQILLQFLKQILGSFSQRPALLAIDPKRTFVRELRRIIEISGQADHLHWVCLGGRVKFNPIWREGMLANSIFITIANTLKLASINFLGSSSENRFWEQSSFNLLKNTLVYCAAKYDYFTFKELYRSLVEAREVSLASDLVDHLTTKQWSGEERANIEMAIDYFKNEFSQMDEKVRTSILATATGFLNEFLEYRVSQILSPKKEEITLFSMTDALQKGSLILLHIENDALARSVGTLLKLMFQEAVLERVSHPDHKNARYAVLVMDEYQDVATSGGGAGLGDDRYLAKARESKAITIGATQSVSSLENAIRSEAATRELLQNFRSRIFGNSSDPRTIRLFQEPMGMAEKERSSHSFSENSHNPTRDLFFGGFDSNKSGLSESISTQTVSEYAVTAKEFSRLKAFEAFSQIFDGFETRFEKLFLKPYFLADIRTPHLKILADLQADARVKTALGMVSLGVFAGILSASSAQAGLLFPNICSVTKTAQFRSCLDFSVSGCMCGWPVPRPCAQISYYVPQTFFEVWPDARDTFFAQHPTASAQFLAHQAAAFPPFFGVDDDFSSYAFQARAIAVPLTYETFWPFPCGGTRLDKPCFDLMSEDLGQNWKTGSADSLQPQFLAWSLSPKACLLKGAASGLMGSPAVPSLGADSGGCSYPIGFLPKYPPSAREACNGWGLFFPRSGTYEGASRSVAALMVAARLKSLGTEVSHTIPTDPDEKWQMIYPQSSSCFKEGENPGVLEMAKGMHEESRILGKDHGYLFLVWKKASCCRDIPEVATAWTSILALQGACALAPGGGV